jgi:hypothetical protein
LGHHATGKAKLIDPPEGQVLMLRPTVTHGMQFSPEDREIDDWMRTVEKIARAASAHSAQEVRAAKGQLLASVSSHPHPGFSFFDVSQGAAISGDVRSTHHRVCRGTDRGR